MPSRKWNRGQILMWLGVAFFSLHMMVSPSAGEMQTPRGDIVSLLQEVSVFKGLDSDQLQKVAAIADMVERKTGDRIIEQGKRLGRMAVALDSEVRIEIDGSAIRVLPPHSLVGEIEFLEKVPATADVVLAAPSRVLLLEHQRFQQVMDEDPSLGYRVMLEMARMEANRLRTNNQGRVR